MFNDREYEERFVWEDDSSKLEREYDDLVKYGKECDFIMPASLINQNICDMCDIPEIREDMKSMVGNS